MAPKTLTGSCACGSITYTSTSPPSHLDYCYCTTCQRVSGAPFMAWMGVSKSSLEWKLSESSKPFIYRSQVGDSGVCIADRECCGKCGCNVTLQYYLYPNKTHIAASTMVKNDFESPKVGCHIWCKSVPSWHVIPDDGVARYAEFDDEFQALLNDYLKRQKGN